MKLPKTDSLILFAFLICVLLWAVSKCSDKRSDLLSRDRADRVEEAEDRPKRNDSISLRPTPAQNAPTPTPTTAPQINGGATPESAPAGKLVRPTVTPVSPAPVSVKTPQQSSPTKTEAKKNETKPSSDNATLFVTIDGLKLRKTPSLKGDVITTLELYEAVTFLGKKSEKQEEISLGYEKVTDYWVKVRSKSGKEGWVFGAGVHYYKMKRKGVME